MSSKIAIEAVDPEANLVFDYITALLFHRSFRVISIKYFHHFIRVF